MGGHVLHRLRIPQMMAEDTIAQDDIGRFRMWSVIQTDIKKVLMYWFKTFLFFLLFISDIARIKNCKGGGAQTQFMFMHVFN